MSDEWDDETMHDLLHDAAPRRLPPPRFSHTTVVATSERHSRRRRHAAVGVASAVAIVVGLGSAVTLLGPPSSGSNDTVADGGSADGGSTDAGSGSGGGGIEPQVRPPRRLPEDPPPPRTPPGQLLRPPSVGSCGPADRAVYVALVRVFPDLAAQEPFPLDRECPAGVTGAGVVVRERGVVGRLEVLLGPVEVAGAAQATAADGRTVTVVSVPATGASSGPYAGSLTDVAERVAAALR